MKRIILALAATTLSSVLSAQEVTSTSLPSEEGGSGKVQVDRNLPNVKNVVLHEVKGRVLDAATGEPTVGVQVQAYNQPLYAAMTDEHGDYTIKLPEWVTSLTFSADGYIVVLQPIGSTQQVPVVKMYSAKFGEMYARQTSAVSKKTALATFIYPSISRFSRIWEEMC